MRQGGEGDDGGKPPSDLPFVPIALQGRWLWYVDRDVFYYDPVGAEMLTGSQTNAGIPLTRDDATAALQPGDRRYIMARLQETAARAALFEADYRVSRSDGAAVRVLWRGVAAEDGRDGSPVVRGIVLDVSELKAAPELDPLPDALNRTTDHLLQARRIATETENRVLIYLIDIVLMHLVLLAARLAHPHGHDVH